ncbi:MAG: tRNA (adenosine(37)-N6)-threonylcarbamoyltransferase complex dimerization subunit type 1 TsaB [Candidatus Nanopelagicales bacterium]
MLLLAIDTSASAVTVALHDGTRVVAEAFEESPQAHGERLAPQVQQVLREAGATPADLTSVAVGIGPGPYTGLRVGIVTGKVMAYALAIPVGGVCSLDALAWLAVRTKTVAGAFAVATDARRKEVYLARYDADAVRLSGPDVLRPGDVAAEVRTGPVVGAGLYPELFTHLLGPTRVTGGAVAAYAVGVLHAGYELADPTPMYLRRPDAVPSVASKTVLQ